MTIEREVYEKHKNLKLAADELGIKWPTLYARLKIQGVKVTGDKSRYGSSSDKLANMAEQEFLKLVPEAKNMNNVEWQSKFDMMVGDIRIDVKCSLPRKLQPHKSSTLSWAFSLKRQNFECDFMVCFGLNEDRSVNKVIVIPHEFFNGLQTISVPIGRPSKWHEYTVEKEELRDFFLSF